MTERAAQTGPALAPTATEATPPTAPARAWARRWWPALGGVVLIAGFLVTRDSSSGPPPIEAKGVQAIVDKTVEKAVSDLRSEPPRSAQVYPAIQGSLVVIQTGDGTSPDEGGLGSGVIVNESGAILTAFHVVDGATTLRITFADGTNAIGWINFSEPENDIAVLSTDRLPEVIVPAVLGGGVRVGDEAIVAGHPLGFVASLTDGVISGLDRSISGPQGAALEGLIQFDAAVNPGSSGGPLLDRNGRVVGIVTALANSSSSSSGPSFSGVGFAVPIGTAGGAAGAPPR